MPYSILNLFPVLSAKKSVKQMNDVENSNKIGTQSSSQACDSQSNSWHWRESLYGMCGVSAVAGGCYLLTKGNYSNLPSASLLMRSQTQATSAATSNSAPVVTYPVPDQIFGMNEAINLVLNSDDIFKDPDGDFLKVTITGSDGSNLPSWLSIQTNVSLTLSGSHNLAGTGWGIDFSNQTVYLADGSAGVRILNVTDPGNPTLLGSYNTLGLAREVLVSDQVAYVAADTAGLQIIDVSNQTSPTSLGNYDTPGNARSVALSGQTVYVADGNSGLQIIDVTNPASPVLLGNYTTSGYARGVVLNNQTAYVAAYSSGLLIFDVSNPASPILLGSYNTPGDAVGVVLNGQTAYVADSAYGLQIIDVSNSASPTLLGNYDTPGNANNLGISGQIAGVADDISGLQVIDVSQSTNPTLLGNYTTPAPAWGVVLKGQLAYVVDTGGLQIITINNPQILFSGVTPSISGCYPIQIQANDGNNHTTVTEFAIIVNQIPPAKNYLLAILLLAMGSGVTAVATVTGYHFICRKKKDVAQSDNQQTPNPQSASSKKNFEFLDSYFLYSGTDARSDSKQFDDTRSYNSAYSANPVMPEQKPLGSISEKNTDLQSMTSGVTFKSNNPDQNFLDDDKASTGHRKMSIFDDLHVHRRRGSQESGISSLTFDHLMNNSQEAMKP